ncbi:hypothetical protein [Leptospira sp. 'Mane']|uniref:hypothetical protein n=1 Tax=Leptospira sp. 'Mane' TaxID=3387407 RepID=UPI00398B63C1
MIVKPMLTFLLLFQIIISRFLFAKEKEKPIDFSQYEIKDSIKIDCRQKKECFRNCAGAGGGLADSTYDQTNKIIQFQLSECNRKCNLIDCNEE